MAIGLEMNNNKLIVVLGMHRSGTSIITRGLQVMGVDLGDRMIPPAGDNPKGFWEDTDLNALNVKMLNAINHDWTYLTLITAKDVETLRNKGYFLRAVELLCQKVDDVAVFGFKDPRVAKLLPFWKEVFNYCKLSVSYVFAIRHPLSIVKSLAKRDGFTEEQGYLLWIVHIITALVHSANDVRVLVDYDRLMQSPDRELKRIAACCDLEIDDAKLQSYKTEFLDQGLRHTVYELNDLMKDKACPPLVLEIYEILLDIASQQETLEDQMLQNNVSRWSDELERIKSPLMLVDKLFAQKLIATETVTERDGQIANLNEAVTERDGQIANLNEAVTERDGQIASLNRTVTEGMYAIQAIRGSTSWRVTMPLRFITSKFRNGLAIMKLLPGITRFGGGLMKSTGKAVRVFAKEGWGGVKRRILFVAGDRKAGGSSHIRPDIARSKVEPNDYGEWVHRYDTLTDSDRDFIQARIDQLPHTPLISIVMPVYNPPLGMLKEAIQSVQNQLYPNWELCIADDASTDKVVRKLLKEHTKCDNRIKVVFRKHNGHISAASNSAIELANGEYIALLDNDDLLAEHALFCVAQAIIGHPDAGIIYSDEDKIDQSGKRYAPYFKSDWNPDLFLSHNMICHLGVYRADLLKKLGGFREGYEGAQDYDLALRCTEQLTPQQIVHIPRVLYHWRSHPGSTAQAGSEKNYAQSAGEHALNDHFARAGVAARAKLLDFGMYRTFYEIPQPAPLVSLIIPTRNGLELIRQCIESILDKTTYKHYEILIVDNNSDDPETLRYFASLADDDRIRILRDERPFNYSALNNSAVMQARGEYVGLINNDIEVISSAWLDEMMGLAIQPGVGAVGARLWYPNDTLQHGGCITGIGGVTGHSHKHLVKGQFGYFGRAQLIQTLSVVTAACLVIKKAIFEEVGGLDESNLKVAFNDVDFCLRVREAGYRNVWTPYAELYHHESATRGYEDSPEKQLRFQSEVLYMQKCWGNTLLNDPAYSPNLTLDREDFSFAWPPRVDRIAAQPAISEE